MIYAYAVTEPPPGPLPDYPGLGDRPLEARTIRDLAAVFTRHDPPPPAATADNVLRHERVVEALMRHLTLLPARFGTTFAGEDPLADALARCHDDLAAGLARVRGCVELGVRVLWRPPANPTDGGGSHESHAAASGPAATSGRAYMLARLAEERRRRAVRERAERIADAVHSPLAALARDSTRRVLATADLPLSAAYLVSREDAEVFRREVGRIADARPDLRVLCTGPWPPYHFTPAIGATGPVELIRV